MENLTMQWGARPVLDRGEPDDAARRAACRGGAIGGQGSQRCCDCWLVCSCRQAGNCAYLVNPRTICGWIKPTPLMCVWFFQNPALLASLTVEENVGFLLRGKGTLSNVEIRERVETCLEAVGLYEVAHLYPGELSGGMQKRVSFARALIDDPQRGDQSMPLLLYDEPTAGLDPVACTRIEDLIVKTRRWLGAVLLW